MPECRKLQPTALCYVLLALITVAVYWPVARLGFINFDDPDYVSGNPRVQAGLTAEGVKWAFVGLYASNWHPLTWLSHMLDSQIYGLKPAGHHLTNLLFHIANTLLLFGLLKRLTGAFWRSAVVAALFALHPLHVESVAWISERKDVLSAFFFLLTLWSYVRYAQDPPPPQAPAVAAAPPRRGRWAWYSLAVVFFALGLMSKPMLVTLPFVLLLLDYWPLGRLSLPSIGQSATPPLRLFLEKAPFFALTAVSCVLTFLVQRACGAMTSLDKGPLEVRLANALVSYVRYLGKTLWPSDLSVFYPYIHLNLDSWQVIAAILALLTVTAGVLWAYKRGPYLPVGWLWFTGMLVPVIGLVQVGKQSLADRYTYLPHIGLFIAMVWGVTALASRLKSGRLFCTVAAAIALIGCGFFTTRQLSYWRDTRTLFEHALDVTSHNFVAYAVLANDCVERGKLAEGIEWCLKSLAIAPDYAEAHNTLGNIYGKQGKYEEAAHHYRAAAADLTYADPRVGLGDVLVKQGKFAEAEAQCREAVRLAPMHLPALFTLATALHKQGKLDEAAEYYRRVVALNPKLFTPHRMLGNVLLSQGKAEEAVAQLRLAIAIRPTDADTHTVLGMALLDLGRMDEAAAQFTEAARLQPGNALANYQLARIHQQRKETGAAIERLRLALTAQPDWPESLNDLAWILATSPDAAVRNGREAVTLAERACKLTNYKMPLLIGTLAAAYAEAGRFPDAVSSAEKARAAALEAGQKDLAQKNQELLELYRVRKAYHEKE